MAMPHQAIVRLRRRLGGSFAVIGVSWVEGEQRTLVGGANSVR
jgi:hypothetical protein